MQMKDLSISVSALKIWLNWLARVRQWTKAKKNRSHPKEFEALHQMDELLSSSLDMQLKAVEGEM